MLLLTCFSKILDGNGVLDIGLKLFSKVMLPFLGSGVTLAILKHCGKCLVVTSVTKSQTNRSIWHKTPQDNL